MIDFLIVGQGLAGSVLALQLLKQGQRILVMGNSQAPSASRVAAGLYNPITGRSMVKTWLADALFPYLIEFYQAAEQTLGTHFLHPMSIFRPFVTAEEQALWQDKVADEAKFITAVATSPPYSVYQHGGLMLQQAGYLDTRCFLQAVRTYLAQQGAYQEGTLAYDQLQLGEGVRYHGLAAKQVIFCEGAQALENPFFNTLPFRPVKGELLHLALPKPLTGIYNRSVFVLPLAGCRALVGATYNREDLSWSPTSSARATLETRLQRNFSSSYTVQDQWAGIRPATYDRRPFIGMHPHYPQVGIFNGLGSKGVSLAPYWARAFAAHLLTQQPLLASVQLDRQKY